MSVGERTRSVVAAYLTKSLSLPLLFHEITVAPNECTTSASLLSGDTPSRRMVVHPSKAGDISFWRISPPRCIPSSEAPTDL